MNYLTAVVGETLSLGHQGENGAVTVRFPVEDWETKYGSGTFTLFNKRTSDPDAYPCTITKDTRYVYWSVTNSDTQYKGKGRCQLIYTVGTTIAKSDTYVTYVGEGLSTTSTPPAAWQSWVNQISARLDAAMLDGEVTAENVQYSSSSTYSADTVGAAIKALQTDTVTAEEVAYANINTYTTGTIGAAVKTLETKEYTSEDIAYAAATEYTAGTVGAAVKALQNKTTTAGDVAYSTSTTYSDGTAGKKIREISDTVSAMSGTVSTMSTAVSGHTSSIATLNSNVSALIVTAETYSIAISAWEELDDCDPYTYSATVTATHTIGDDTEVELVNNNCVLFANYGFAVYEVSGQTVKICAMDVPDGTVSLRIEYRG